MPVGRVEATVAVARPPEDVFAFFLDFDKYGNERRAESVVKEPEGPTSAGTVFRFGNGKGRETTMRFTSLEPNRKIEFDGDVGWLRPVGAFIIEPTEGGSKLTITVAPNPVGAFKVASPAVNVLGTRTWAKRLAQIKAAIES